MPSGSACPSNSPHRGPARRRPCWSHVWSGSSKNTSVWHPKRPAGRWSPGCGCWDIHRLRVGVDAALQTLPREAIKPGSKPIIGATLRRRSVTSDLWPNRATPYAQVYLGVLCRDDHGVAQDDAEAVKWYLLAAEQGSAIGQADLGTMYDNGEGVGQDDVEAVKWFRLAPSSYAIGQANLGSMYENGRGVAQDDVEAVKWYRLAAEQGDADGQFNLGWMYETAAAWRRTMPRR